MALQINRKVKHLATLNNQFRFLIDDKYVVYVTVEPDLLPNDDWSFINFISFPPGDWNQGHISKDQHTGSLGFSSISYNIVPGVKNIWHQTQIDHLEFEQPCSLSQNIRIVTHPFFRDPVIIKFASFPCQIDYIETETIIYNRLQGTGISPEFLGHVTEEGRGVIGFVLELIAGSRPAEPRDLTICQDVLARLHALGIKHGDIHGGNFLVREGKALLIDFEISHLCDEKKELELEYDHLTKLLGGCKRGN
ncbi:hypothetical protein F5Y00DRAFT_245726 [Daldinia vernicosa]|uniref:uncharacterized protein n=1 Tax=Daldinia vernicosa TaxID=114800 RepID=UPI002008BBB5|nr:uncharacterized protein F5Y00DRAFT_245726 [Daldinia vernicosa]KAI0845659.1 hypothetical protein F5Y00DRAFT_245726 [Daldinia vernicosa]